MFLGEWTSIQQDRGRPERLGAIRDTEAARLLQRSCDLLYCQVLRHTKSSWTWLNQETITCNANWVWKGYTDHREFLSVSPKIDWFLMLASVSIVDKNSVTTRPCQRHGLKSEFYYLFTLPYLHSVLLQTNDLNICAKTSAHLRLS